MSEQQKEGFDAKKLEVFRVSPELRAKFFAHIQKVDNNFSLRVFLTTEGAYKDGAAVEAELKRRGMFVPDGPPSALLSAFSKMFSKIVGVTEGMPPKVLIRHLEAKNEEHLRRIVDGLEDNGGKIGDLVGVCMSEIGSRADEELRMDLQHNNSFSVLLIYDPRKLQKLTDEEARSHSSFYGGYGYKPMEGETFKSALMGAIVI